MKYFLSMAVLASTGLAFPNIAKDPRVVERMQTAAEVLRRQDSLGISKAETNCGPTPCLTFDAEDQLVSVTGQNVWQSPAVSDIRGPCPGLNATTPTTGACPGGNPVLREVTMVRVVAQSNAAANHGYLPRSGIASIEETVSGLGAAYNMAPTLAAALAAYAIALDGNVAEMVWSIGGPLPTDDLTGALLGTGQGLSYSHNNYEGDSSIGRNDAYLDHGNAHSLNITKFEEVYAVGQPDDRYTLDKFRQRFETVQDFSIANNPYYFTGLFSTVVVVPAAYNFVINFMSNHSAAEPSGYLNGYNFKSFFGVTGEPGSFVWQRGQERIPDAWYRRPTTNQYTANDVFEDVAIGYAAYPNTLKFGGNTGTPNSFVGVNVRNLTGGAYDAQDLFKSNNLACFSFNILAEAIPNFLDKPLNDLAPVTNLINKYFGPIIGGFSCPQQGQYQTGLFDHFPGYKYHPKGPDTNY